MLQQKPLRSAAGEEEDNLNLSSFGGRSATPEAADPNFQLDTGLVQKEKEGTLGDGSRYEASIADLGTRQEGAKAGYYREGYTPFNEARPELEWSGLDDIVNGANNATTDFSNSLTGGWAQKDVLKSQRQADLDRRMREWNDRKRAHESQYWVAPDAGTTRYGTNVSLTGYAPYSYATADQAAANQGANRFDAGSQTNWSGQANDTTFNNANASQQAALNRMRGR